MVFLGHHAVPCVNFPELAQPFDLSLPGVSKHLKVLQRAGLITQRRNAQWRPCRLEAPRLKEVSDWVGQYRRFWDESFERLDEYSSGMKRGSDDSMDRLAELLEKMKAGRA